MDWAKHRTTNVYETVLGVHVGKTPVSDIFRQSLHSDRDLLGLSPSCMRATEHCSDKCAAVHVVEVAHKLQDFSHLVDSTQSGVGVQYVAVHSTIRKNCRSTRCKLMNHVVKTKFRSTNSVRSAVLQVLVRALLVIRAVDRNSTKWHTALDSTLIRFTSCS